MTIHTSYYTAHVWENWWFHLMGHICDGKRHERSINELTWVQSVITIPKPMASRLRKGFQLELDDNKFRRVFEPQDCHLIKPVYAIPNSSPTGM